MNKVLLVLSPQNEGSVDLHPTSLGYAYGIISYLVQISSLTILLPWDVDVTECEDYLKEDFNTDVVVKSQTEINKVLSQANNLRSLFSLAFLDKSSEIYYYLNVSDYRCVVFDVFDAPGFIPIRAKKTGLGLEQTLLVSWLRSCHEFYRLQVFETPQSLWLDNHVNFAEIYCCENCDFVIPHTETILKWCLGQKWNINRNRVLMLNALKTGTPFQWSRDENSVVFSDSPNEEERQSTIDPLVSICVAHFNDGRNLVHLLKSIEASDYKNFEVVVVDDGSTDVQSLKIVKSLESTYGSDSWRFILKDENESIGPTRNFAVTQAKGELIIFMDSDNLATKTMISDFVRGILKSGADCLTCGMIQFKGDDGAPGKDGYIGQWLPLGACLELGFTDNVFGDANFCIKKSVFKTLGGFCGIRGHVADDWEFLSRLVLKGFSLDVIPKGLFFYRVRSGSWLQSAWSKRSIFILRTKFLANVGPQHVELLHNLLLQLVGENDKFRSSFWKLDRKVVKAALWLSEIVSEEHRLFIEDACMRFNRKLLRIKSSTCHFMIKKTNLLSRIFKVFGLDFLNPQHDLSKTTSNGAHNRRSSAGKLSITELNECLARWELPLDRPIFAYYGELSPAKRPMGFLKLAYWMQMFQDNSFFVMVGDGFLKEQVQTTAANYKLINFKWIASIENIEKFYSIISGLVITSAYEPQGPKEMFESLANGIPVFATDVGQTKSVLGRYGSGLVVRHDPEYKDFADSFKLWKNNLEIYKIAAVDTASLVER